MAVTEKIIYNLLFYASKLSINHPFLDMLSENKNHFQPVISSWIKIGNRNVYAVLFPEAQLKYISKSQIHLLCMEEMFNALCWIWKSYTNYNQTWINWLLKHLKHTKIISCHPRLCWLVKIIQKIQLKFMERWSKWVYTLYRFDSSRNLTTCLQQAHI